MKTNPILKEIRQTRDKLADEAGGDMRRLFAIVRERAKAARAHGETVIPEPKPCSVVHEDAAEYQTSWQRQGMSTTNPILEEIRQAREEIIAEAGGDLEQLFKMLHERESAAKARGVVFVPVPKRGKKGKEGMS